MADCGWLEECYLCWSPSLRMASALVGLVVVFVN